MKAKAYIESKYRKMDTQERERNEGMTIFVNYYYLSLGDACKEDELVEFE